MDDLIRIMGTVVCLVLICGVVKQLAYGHYLGAAVVAAVGALTFVAVHVDGAVGLLASVVVLLLVVAANRSWRRVADAEEHAS